MDKLFGPDMLWLVMIELQLTIATAIAFLYLIYHLIAESLSSLKKSKSTLEETNMLVLGHMDRIVGEYFYKELDAFEFKHAINICDYTTPELLALCEEKGWTNDIFYSLLLVDYNEFNND